MGFLDNYKTYDPDRDGYGSAQDWNRSFYNRISPDEAWAILLEENPYVILGIKPSSSKAEIKKAFHKLAMKWHPDKNPNQIKKATAMMKKINAAYSLIG